MKTFTRIDDTTIQIDGVRYYAKAKPDKPKWPTDMRHVPYNNLTGRDTLKHEYRLSCIRAARAINGEWEPHWEDDEQVKWCPYLFRGKTDPMDYTDIDDRANSFVWFQSKEACQHFIDHFGLIWLEAIG
jgi:hypothetical protein